MCEDYNFPTSLSALVIFYFFLIKISAKWHLPAVLICTALAFANAEHRLMCGSAVRTSSLQKCLSHFAPSKLVCFCCRVAEFSAHAGCWPPIWDLQASSPVLRGVFSQYCTLIHSFSFFFYSLCLKSLLIYRFSLVFLSLSQRICRRSLAICPVKSLSV